MALRSVICKATLTVADMDRGYYADHSLVVARHPSETDERMMVRILAFALNAHPDLAFGRGLSTDDEPDMWLKDLTGEIENWIEVGQPEEKWLRKASPRARAVRLYAYGRAVDIWWKQNRDKLTQLPNLTVYRLEQESTSALADIAGRNMQLQCNVQDGEVWFGNEDQTLHIIPQTLWPAP